MVKKIKLPYEYVSKEVDKLYEKQFNIDNQLGIDKHCEFIADFINACGWTEENFVRAMFGFEDLDEKN